MHSYDLMKRVQLLQGFKYFVTLTISKKVLKNKNQNIKILKIYCASFHNYYTVYNEKDTISEKHWQESWRNKKNSSLLYVLVKKAYGHLISVALQ